MTDHTTTETPMLRGEWRETSYREPPDNREITVWEFYGTRNNLLAFVVGTGSTWRVEVAPPVGRPRDRDTTINLHGTTVDDAKQEADCLLRHFGHVQTPGQGSNRGEVTTP